MHKISENTDFYSPVFSRIRTELWILFLCGKIRTSENPCSSILYAVIFKTSGPQYSYGLHSSKNLFIQGKLDPLWGKLCLWQLKEYNMTMPSESVAYDALILKFEKKHGIAATAFHIEMKATVFYFFQILDHFSWVYRTF